MSNISTRGIWPWLGLAALLVVADQVTKVLILANYQLGNSTFITSFFNIVRVHNTGAAFSFLADAGGWQRWFFTAVGVAAAVFIVWMLRTHPGEKLFAFALACILGGALGNVIDRLLHGHFPAFNLADAAITVGAISLILDEIQRVRRNR
jgi:signal peptidase II